MQAMEVDEQVTNLGLMRKHGRFHSNFCCWGALYTLKLSIGATQKLTDALLMGHFL